MAGTSRRISYVGMDFIDLSEYNEQTELLELCKKNEEKLRMSITSPSMEYAIHHINHMAKHGTLRGQDSEVYDVCGERVLKPKDVVRCPYDPNHLMNFSKYFHHIVRCPEVWRLGTTHVQCPFNGTEIMPIEMLEEHIMACRYRSLLDPKEVLFLMSKQTDSSTYKKFGTVQSEISDGREMEFATANPGSSTSDHQDVANSEIGEKSDEEEPVFKWKHVENELKCCLVSRPIRANTRDTEIEVVTDSGRKLSDKDEEANTAQKTDRILLLPDLADTVLVSDNHHKDTSMLVELTENSENGFQKSDDKLMKSFEELGSTVVTTTSDKWIEKFDCERKPPNICSVYYNEDDNEPGIQNFLPLIYADEANMEDIDVVGINDGIQAESPTTPSSEESDDDYEDDRLRCYHFGFTLTLAAISVACLSVFVSIYLTKWLTG